MTINAIYVKLRPLNGLDIIVKDVKIMIYVRFVILIG